MKPLYTFSALLLLFPCLAQAQKSNPYQSIGKKAKMVTLSAGRYQETFVNDTLQRVGTVIINVKRHTIVQLLDADSLNETTEDNSTASRWYSIDPLAEKYPSISPYAFCANNPIHFVDPDGSKITIATTTVDPTGDYSMMAIRAVAGQYLDRVTAYDGELVVNTEGLTAAQIAAEPGFQFLSQAAADPHNILVETNTVAEGVDRITGDAVSIPMYDPVTNPHGKSDINFSTTSRGEADKEAFLATPHNTGAAVWQQFDAKPKDGYDGQVVIPISVVGIVNTENGKQLNAAPILFHSLVETFNRTAKQQPFMDAHKNAQSTERSLPDNNGAKSPSPGQYHIDPNIQAEYRRELNATNQ